MKLSEITHNSNENYTQLLANYVLDSDLLSVTFDEIFNNILSLTNRACESSVSQINIIGYDKYWRKTDIGFSKDSCNATHLLSEMVLSHNQFFEVLGILEDNRIINKPIVINEQAIKSYAAIPITLSDGAIVGTLSLMNNEAVSLSDNHRMSLSLMERNIASQIELCLKNKQLECIADENSVKENSEIPLASEPVISKEELFADLDAFLHRAVHDLRSPLNAIKNITSWIKEDIEDGFIEDNEKNFAMVANSTVRMETLLSDLSTFSQIGREIYPHEVFNLDSLVNEICGWLTLPNHFNISVENCEIELPKEPLLFALNHLVSNAIKHHDNDKGNIDIKCDYQGENYQISVTDDGPGISDVYYNKIFEAFQTLKSKDQVEGSGLGLAMIRKKLLPYSAEVTVESQIDKGSTFTIIWPKHNNKAAL